MRQGEIVMCFGEVYAESGAARYFGLMPRAVSPVFLEMAAVTALLIIMDVPIILQYLCMTGNWIHDLKLDTNSVETDK